jgi:pimeloyl-ACP methyl ester carboxylesterase
MRTTVRAADGLAIRTAERPSPGAQELVLLLNPWPESLYAWESIWTRLPERYRLVAIDLPGFGGSERRADLLSPQAMGDFLVRLLDEWELAAPHVVGPDVGTGATLFAASASPGSIRSAVVGSGGAAYPLQVTGALRDMIEAPDLEPLRALDAHDVIAGALATMEHYEPSAQAREDYIKSYAGDRFAESANYVRSYPRDLPVLAQRLGEILIPVQIISGLRDPLVPPGNAEYLHERLPLSRLNLLNTGHFAWEDAADDYATILISWIDGGYQKVLENG